MTPSTPQAPGEGEVLWQPTPQQVAASRLAAYERWLHTERGLTFADYRTLWRWSVAEIEPFWQSVWDHFEVLADGSCEPVLGSRQMPGASWFPNASLNYAEHVFRNATDARPALITRREDAPVQEVSWAALQRDTGAFAARLRALGVVAGDRVASYLPNRAETVVAFLACASIGAIWSSCAPDMGASVVLDRLRQIEPKLLLATDSVHHNGKTHDRVDVVGELLRELPSIRNVVHVPGPSAAGAAAGRLVDWRDRLSWDEAVAQPAELRFERLAFSHPLWIVYSSGTTGLPKAMVHGHGGIVLTHLKTLALQHDLRPADRMLFLGGTGWIVWNLQVGGLLTGASIVLYDGNPAWPDSQALWRFIDEQRVTLFGCGAAFLVNCMKDGLRPRDFVALPALRAINSTGSPLPIDAYRWVYAAVKPDVWLASISGGTDVASGFVACAPSLPVTAGEIQHAELGVAACAFNEAGQAVEDEVGELVITQPMPSMPLHFWGDPGQRRYLESYFETYPGVWRHGDWIRFTPRGTAVIYGRSDSTINRFGIRMGTAEIYRVVQELPEVRDSLVVDLEYLGRPSFMPLFVVLQPGCVLDDALKARIAQEIRTKASARHVPNEVIQVAQVPYTLTGKKMEVPLRRLLLGQPRHKVASPDAMLNPDSLDFFADLAGRLNPVTAAPSAWAGALPPTRSAGLARVGRVRPAAYARSRNHLDGAVTGLSPYITHGLLTLPDVLAGVLERGPLEVQHKLVFELGWREFFRHAWGHLGEGILASIHEGPRPEAAYAPEMPEDIRQARTGVPVIDEAVRTLYATGTLHNHARMWLASYVVHVRHVHWRAGADWLVAHLLDGDLASNHLSWQWVAGTGSHKPYLFNAENVARYAPPHWHSPGTVVDQSYETLDRLARGAGPRQAKYRGAPDRDALSRYAAGQAPGDDPGSPTEGAGITEPPLFSRPPADLRVITPTAADTERLRGRTVWLVHPWAVRSPPADLPEGAQVVGVYLKEHHELWPWPEARWRWVDAAMVAVAPERWCVDAPGLAQALQGAAEVRSVDDPHLHPWWPAGVALDPAPRLFPLVERPCSSFSQWWTRATRGLRQAQELLQASNTAPG